MPSTTPNNYQVLTTRVDALSNQAGLLQSQALIQAPGAHYVVLPYVEFVMRAQRQPEVARALDEADLRLPNGVALNWAIEYRYGGPARLGRLLVTLASIVICPSRVHRLAPARFDSSNFTWPLLEWAATNHKTVCLIGSPKHQSIEQTGRHLEQAISALDIVATFPGRLSKAAEIKMTQDLRRLRPDIILIGMGFPAQELFMQRLKSHLTHGLMIGEGGSFDYQQFGGRIKRAPTWIRHSGLEWFWRLLREPSRLRRQLIIPSFIWQVYRSSKPTQR